MCFSSSQIRHECVSVGGLFIYLFIYLLKGSCPVNRTVPHQGVSAAHCQFRSEGEGHRSDVFFSSKIIVNVGQPQVGPADCNFTSEGEGHR